MLLINFFYSPKKLVSKKQSYFNWLFFLIYLDLKTPYSIFIHARRRKNVIDERESELMCIDKESKSQIEHAEKIRDIIQLDCDKRSRRASEEYESVLIKVNEESDKMKTEVVTSSDAIISELDSESANMSVLEATPGSPQEYRMLQNKLQDAIDESVKKQLELKKMLLFEATEDLQTELDAQMLKTKT